MKVVIYHRYIHTLLWFPIQIFSYLNHRERILCFVLHWHLHFLNYKMTRYAHMYPTKNLRKVCWQTHVPDAWKAFSESSSLIWAHCSADRDGKRGGTWDVICMYIHVTARSNAIMCYSHLGNAIMSRGQFASRLCLEESRTLSCDLHCDEKVTRRLL